MGPPALQRARHAGRDRAAPHAGGLARPRGARAHGRGAFRHGHGHALQREGGRDERAPLARAHRLPRERRGRAGHGGGHAAAPPESQEAEAG